MDFRTQRRLRRLIRNEHGLAAHALVTGEADVKEHLDRIAAAETLLASQHALLRADSLIALAVAVATCVLVAVLLLLRVDDTPIHFAGRAESIVIHLPDGVRWTAAPNDELVLRSIDNVSALWLPGREAIANPGCDGTVENPNQGDVRLVELSAKGDIWLTLSPTGDGGLEIRTQGAPLDTKFSGESPNAEVRWRAAATTPPANVADEFVRIASGCGGATLQLSGSTLAFENLFAGTIAFLRRGAENLQVGRHVSSLLEGDLTFFDVDAEARKLRAGELVSLEKPSGQATIRVDQDSLVLTFDGRVDDVALGRDRRSANPSQLAYLKHNEQVLLAGWGLVAMWGFLWSARQMLLR